MKVFSDFVLSPEALNSSVIFESVTEISSDGEVSSRPLRLGPL